MKRIAICCVLLAFVASCRRPETPPAPDPAAEALERQAAAMVERRALFGERAVEPDVLWTEGGLGYRILQIGEPPLPGVGAVVHITYVGRLKDGTVFDRADNPVAFTIGRTISGLSTGLEMLGKGGRAVFFIPPALGYGARKVMGIPPNSGLIFDVEVKAIER